jgi:seryl-tRNA synthetase
MRPRDAEDVVATLYERGELWQHARGLTGLRGAPLKLFHHIERLIARVSNNFARGAEWQVPRAVSFDTLEDADYFSCFPQWLTAAAHLSDDQLQLEKVARASKPGRAAAGALVPAAFALPPALCYHAYAALQCTTIERPVRLTTQGTCWRHEGDRHAPLERGWAFTMREVVQIGSDRQIGRFCKRGEEIGRALAGALGLECTVAPASDPFFMPTARGKALLQNVKTLKHELLLPIGERAIAASSFNHHERFFGAAFEIALPSGQPASSGCIAFGIERWLLAFLVRHGTEPARWPELPRRLQLKATA